MNFQFKSRIFYFICFFVLSSCGGNEQAETTNGEMAKAKNEVLFQSVPSSESGIDFKNTITVVADLNNTYRASGVAFNGGGVAMGDINNDGLPDLYFLSNENENKLYLNKGDLKFEDITEKAGVVGGNGWHYGVNMMDINGDGYTDIYICRGGAITDPELRSNLLYINNGDNTFSEQAEAFGLADKGYSVHASFFDYDNDNDLDMYLISQPADLSGIKMSDYLKGLIKYSVHQKDKLYENIGNNKFEDVSKKAKITQNFGFGLSVTNADLNDDGFTDIYVTNDYTQRDHLWMNNGDGTFSDKALEMMKHIPLFSMGTDIGDLNNDGLEDIFNTEMLPRDYKRSKTNMADMNVMEFDAMVAMDFHHQYMHNMLQLNRGNSHFSEISQIAGVDKTDWSWACFLADLDNDGMRDLFVSNGYRKEILNRDDVAKMEAYLKENDLDVAETDAQLKAIDAFFTEQKLSNRFLKNKDGLKFTDVTSEWSEDIPSFSNGATIGDLDNDGDLDIVTNNIDEEAFLYKNNASENGNNYLQITLKGLKENPYGLGAKVTIYTASGKQFFEQKVTRGYLSSVDPTIHFGLGKDDNVEKIEVFWTKDKMSIVKNVKANTRVEIDINQSTPGLAQNNKPNKMLRDITSEHFDKPHVHKENRFNDYHTQILLPHRVSSLGPFVSVADVNGDGLDDFYIGGAHKSAGTLYQQDKQGKFTVLSNPAFDKDKESEDTGSQFFDYDQDGDMDLYVVSGGAEKTANTPYYNDRIYLNNGKGIFKRISNFLEIPISGSRVAAADYDRDGDVDLFVGGRIVPNVYPFPPNSCLLQNRNGKFVDAANNIGQEFKQMGMVTDAIWADINGDKWQDLLVVGEWMPLKVYINKKGKLEDQSDVYIKEKSTGWWSSIKSKDIDNDGDLDFVVGNLGENYKFKASEEKPFHVYANDFDKNGSCDVVLAKYDGDRKVPVRGKQCMSDQMPDIKTAFPTFASFADADLDKIIATDEETNYHYEATMFSSIILYNEGTHFRIEKLPQFAQFSPVNGTIFMDVNGDNKEELIIAGNMYGSEVETSRADASIGLVLTSDATGKFTHIPAVESGFYMQNDVKDMKPIQLAGGEKAFLVSCNDGELKLWSK